MLARHASALLRAATHLQATASGVASALQPAASSEAPASTSGRLDAPPRVLPPWQQPHHQRAGFAKEARKKKAGSGGAAAQPADSSASTSYEDDVLPTEQDVVRIVLQAVENCTPHLDVRTVRGSTKTVFVPGVMPPSKGRSLALRWLVRAAEARKRGHKGTFSECLALELLLAFQKKGGARQKRDELHKLALQNRANLHLRWW